jgi:CRP/FNR family cyclic AMP-dependent transcriptional regulator
MSHKTPESDRFKIEMRESLLREAKSSRSLKVTNGDSVYMIGEKRQTVYFIESGQIKLVMLSAEGKECMIAVHGSGDVFGELCLSGLGGRLETATAMEDCSLKEIPCDKFLSRLGRDSLLEGFVRYLTVRIAEQQQVIAHLVTVDSEHRLGETLLQLGRKFGKKDPRTIRVELKISHEELATMVGTTRPRISVFMQRFRNLGLIESNIEHHLIIKESKLANYLTSIT